jgi:hypothetical protein
VGSGFLTVGPEEGRSFFRNVVFLVFFVVTMEKLLEEVYEDSDIQSLSNTVMLLLKKYSTVRSILERI